MAIEVFPAAVTSSINANSITATTSNTMYEGIIALDPAIYTVTCPSGTITNIHFFSGATRVTTVTTVSGTISLNLASAADRVRLWTDTGSNVVVTITKTAAALSNVFNGTLDTITSTGTYTGTSTSGLGYAVLVGGGGGGGSLPSPSSGNTRLGGGGGSGSVGGKLVTLTGSMAVTIGAAGLGISGSTGGTGGTSTFDGMSCPGGVGGAVSPTDGNAGQGGAGGAAPTGADVYSAGGRGSNGNENNYAATTKIYSFVVNGTTGGGQGGYYNTPSPQSGTGSGIGTGGGGASQNNGFAATGYGAGGGGASNREVNALYTGGNGSPGVLYVLRF